uniref:LisH domain-containing protein n=1 Tax=Panagrolaimus sp. ES5 TaxID=591445 RepID=A0AC34FA79_9BILA
MNYPQPTQQLPPPPGSSASSSRPIRQPQTPIEKPFSSTNAVNLTPCEIQAKDKLLSFIYEYLTHIGATKTAETLKNECLPNQNPQVGDHPGLLSTWFILFWDLYTGDPERREKNNPTQEAKAFHDFGFVQPTTLRPGGYMGPPMGPPGMVPPSDGMMSPYFPRPPPYGGGRPPHSFGPPGSGPPPNQMMFPPGGDVRAAAAAAAMHQNRMPRMPSNMNFSMRPSRYGPPYMDSPTGNPGFFMPPDSMPPSSMTPSTSVPTSMPPINGMPMSEGGGGGNGPQQPLPSLNSSNNPLTGIMNGEDIKHSPSHHIGSVHGQNGNGTPLGPGSQQHPSMIGPGSAAPGAPSSVPAQQPGSVINPTTSASSQIQPPPSSMNNPNQTQQQNFGDHSNIMDFQSGDITNTNNNPNSHENLEIKKIREGLLDDFPSET